MSDRNDGARPIRTIPHHRVGRMPVRTLAVDVVAGPDLGKTFTSSEIIVGTAAGSDLQLSDQAVSRFHMIASRGDSGILIEDKGSMNGTWMGDARLERAVVFPGTRLGLGVQTIIRVHDGSDQEVELIDGEELGGLRARSPAMRRLCARIERAARTDVPVLIDGESGTGKEVVAQTLHRLSARESHPLVVVDCGSLAPNLVASELFGHERGAFTGADRRHIGAFERANGGTIFLDEVGELPESLQPILLGALERRAIRRLGGREEIRFDARVVCATHRDLHADVNAGRFRLDLFYRIAVVKLHVPPLRERPEDIPVLVAMFRERFSKSVPGDEVVRHDSLFNESMMTALARHDWPGNVRELRNVVEATIAMDEPPLLGSRENLPPPPPGAYDRLSALTYREARASLLAEFELSYLKAALERGGGNVSRAARLADMDRSHLFEMLKRHGFRE